MAMALIPCGITTGTPCALQPRLPSSLRTRRRRIRLDVVRAENSSPEPRYVVNKNPEVIDRILEYRYKPSFWHGPQWEWLGFLVKYLWLLSVPFSAVVVLILCITYLQRPEYKEAAVTNNGSESVQSSELFEEPGAYDSDVFESNPTEVAPSLQ